MITDFNQLDLTKQYTYADYLTWEFEERVELFKGWVHKMSPAPMRKHQLVFGHLYNPIYQFLDNKSCEVYSAPFDVRLIKKKNKIADALITTVVQPDICVVCDPEKLDDKGCIGAPDWIIEILSPGTSKKEIKEKFALYEENGVREYWVVYPEYGEVSVYDLINEVFVLRNRYVKGEDIPVGIFNGFSIQTEKVFR